MAKNDATLTSFSSTLPSSVPTATMNDLTLLVNSVDTIKTNVKWMTTKGNASSSQFYHLGTRYEDDVTSWNAINNLQNNFDIFIDAHRVIETMHHKLNSTNSLEFVNTLHNLQIPSLHQGLTINDFETESRKFSLRWTVIER